MALNFFQRKEIYFTNLGLDSAKAHVELGLEHNLKSDFFELKKYIRPHTSFLVLSFFCEKKLISRIEDQFELMFDWGGGAHEKYPLGISS